MTARCLLAILATALVAGVAGTLALAAAAHAWGNPAAAWIAQPIPHLLRRRTRP